MYKRIAFGGLAVLGLAMLGTAATAANAPGFYAGAGVGKTSVKLDGFDTSDTAFKIFGGYSFNEYVSLEAAYFDSGNQQENFDDGSVELNLDGINFSVVGWLPVGDAFSLFAKVGRASYNADVTARSGGEVISADGTNEELTYGFGAAVNFAGPFEIRAEYEALDINGGDFDTWSVGGAYRF
jgi:opacity protein-like surface antigen